ncbi:SDR family NAD(P)-dependent oxidoreductase [Spirillospora sp. CA-294931]|uniref:SDR family NAD(P)-dependent oxidoreductase n=1 Tax=Spirillospora sp. CA-294931 TaxID=3240042 RepID=UPI003D914D7F
MNGKTALVTGGSRGLGRAIARRLAADGAEVCVHYSASRDAALDTVAAIEKDGGTAFAVRAEFGTEGDIAALMAGLEGRELDILVNNAACGNLETLTTGSIENLTPAQFDEVFAINVRAPFFLVQSVLPLLRDGGRIITISSAAARVAVPSQIGYAMTKGALEVMSRTLANALGRRGITVNTVAPGATDTGINDILHTPEVRDSLVAMTALGRIGTPEEVANAVAFLASDEARWITGNLIDATGGLHLGPLT